MTQWGIGHIYQCMKEHVLDREQWLPRPIDEVFVFFSRPENLQVITPPWLDFRMVEAPKELSKGSRIRYRLRWRLMPIWWTTEISEWNPPYRFADRELSGPYTLWNHEHDFVEHRNGTTMRDLCASFRSSRTTGSPGSRGRRRNKDI